MNRFGLAARRSRLFDDLNKEVHYPMLTDIFEELLTAGRNDARLRGEVTECLKSCELAEWLVASLDYICEDLDYGLAKKERDALGFREE